jgi:galactitol-specific phosphotransferase system IIC component
MDSLKAALAAYAFTIVFSLLIAALLPALGCLVKRLRLDGEVVDLSVPTANSMKEDESIAVAIAVARAQRR